MRKLIQKIKNIWNNLSLSRRAGIKDTSKTLAMVLGVSAIGIVVSPFVFPGMALGTAAAIIGLSLGTVGTAAAVLLGLPKLPGLRNEIKHGHEEVTWKNALGQTVKSTQVQQRDLVIAQRRIHFWNLRDPAEAKRISSEFNTVADKATVVEDIENGDGKFHFANKKTKTQVVTTTTDTPL